MRQDTITSETAAAEEEGEAAFLERHWSEVWRRHGRFGAKSFSWRLRLAAEYQMMRPYLAGLPSGARLLDGGCGVGEWTLFLGGLGFSVLGLDISREVVLALIRLHPKAGHPGAEFMAGDIRNTGLPGASFDGYLSWGVFEHFAEGLGPCINEARRLLKPGGLLFVTVPFDSPRLAWQDRLARRRTAVADDGRQSRHYQWRLSQDEFRRQLTDGGFQVLEIKPIHKRQGILRSLQSLGLDWRSPFSRLLGMAIAPLVPSAWFGHMLMAVARKPVDISPAIHAKLSGGKDAALDYEPKEIT